MSSTEPHNHDEATIIAVCAEWKRGDDMVSIARRRPGWSREDVKWLIKKHGAKHGATARSAEAIAQTNRSLAKQLGRPKPMKRGEALKAAMYHSGRLPGPEARPAALPANLRELPADQMLMVPFHAIETHRQCKWPVGEPVDGEFQCCGRTRDGRYCAEHNRISARQVPADSQKEFERGLRRYL